MTWIDEVSYREASLLAYLNKTSNESIPTEAKILKPSLKFTPAMEKTEVEEYIEEAEKATANAITQLDAGRYGNTRLLTYLFLI
jgi:hypothetical protein